MNSPSLHDIFDLGEIRYIAQVVPECYPDEPLPVLKNWTAEEREAYCGIYTKTRLFQYAYGGGWSRRVDNYFSKR